MTQTGKSPDLPCRHVPTDDGALIYVEEHGQGRPVLLVHGWMMSGRLWQRQTGGALPGCRVVLPDLRGHGRSSKPAQGHDLVRYAADLQAVVEALGLKDFILAGWSLAGPLVLEYWRRYGPGRVAGLALVEATPYPLAGAAWNTHGLAGRAPDAVAERVAPITADRRAFAAMMANAMFHGGSAGENLAWLSREILLAPPYAAEAIYWDYCLRDLRPVLSTVTVPSLVVVGQSPHMCFGPPVGDYLARSLPDPRLSVCDQSGHMPFFEEPLKFNQALLELVNRA